MLTATLALGFPSATDAFIQHFVKDKCLAIIEDVDKLDNIPDGFIHYQLIRFCQATRLQYLNGHVQIANQNVLHEEDDTGVRGGVERGMLSTTTHKKVAIFYLAGRKLPTIFSIQVGAVSKGASLSHLSQFPMEEEVLEVVGVPRVVNLEDGNGSVLEIPMQISCPKTSSGASCWPAAR